MDEKLYEEAKKLNDVDDSSPASGDVLERIIHAVGDMGVYQRWLFAAMMPFMVFLVFMYCVQMFIAATPQQHWCRVPELEHLDVELRRNLSIPGATLGPNWDRCAVYVANWTEVLQTMVPPIGANTTSCRHGWEFIFDDIPYPTIVSEREWVCDRSGNAPFAQSVYFAGSFVGCALFGWMGDQYGRLPALMGANLIGCLGSIATIFTSGVWDFSICRFFVGLANDFSATMMYILVLEYVGPQHRTWVSNMSIGLFYGSGAVLLAGLALWLLDWRLLMWATSLPMLFVVATPWFVPESVRAGLDWRLLVWATSLPMLFVIATPWFVPESVRWLTSKGKVDKAVNTLRKFERINKKKIPEDLMAEFVVVSNQKSTVDESIRAALQNSALRNALLVVIIISMVSGTALDAVLRMSESIGDNFFLTFTLSSFSEIPALALVTLILDRAGRRFLIVVTMIAAGLLAVWCAFTSQGLLQTVLAVCIRFFINMAVAIQIQVTTELIPTGARASGNALVHLAVFAAIMCSPYVVYSGRLWAALPLLIVGVACILAGALALCLPETKGKPMPQTIVEADKMIRNGMLWRKPATSKNKDAEYSKVNTEMR